MRSHLSTDAQKVFLERYNAALDESKDAMEAERLAWETIHEKFSEGENGVWS